jgi:CTP synthase
VEKIDNLESTVTIGMVGKYTYLEDSYISILEAFRHAGAEANTEVNVEWIDAEKIENGKNEQLKKMNGLLVPGGFGIRGAEGKISAINYARRNNIPFLGICFGFQLAVVEYGQNVLELEGHSTEIDQSTKHPLIYILPEQDGIENMGGTMRLGEQTIKIKENTIAYDLYGKNTISERHRHRYEVNPGYIEKFEKNGLIFSGRSPDKIRMEICELPTHPYFIASQFHPEFKSHPLSPAPLFCGLVKASLAHKKRSKRV